MGAESHDLIEEQKAYYRSRAGEYDEWFLRQGRYWRGPEHKRQWDAEVDEVRAALERFRPAGSVLELAAGTGWWTEQLLRWADWVTAVDASPETVEVSRRRVGEGRVRYVLADIFRWRPDARYDVVFFGFWLSHVPPDRFEAFWDTVRAALAPEGRVFFVDSLRTESSTAVDHSLADPDDVVTVRKLNDGQAYRIVKVFYDPAELSARLAGLGWDVTTEATTNYFLYGRGGLAGGGE